MERKHGSRVVKKQSAGRKGATVASRAQATKTGLLPFEVRPSSIHGVGAYATRKIRKEQRVVEYVGERISDEESNRRYDDEAMANHHTFLFSVRGGCIDGARGGNESRFINHSCEPNVEARLERNRVFLYALRTIYPGEELCYDYAYERSDDMTEEDIARYPCRCLAPSCRGTILAPEPPKPEAARPRRKQQREGQAGADSRKKPTPPQRKKATRSAR